MSYSFQRDVLLISCDLIYMNIPLHHIANMYRTYDATVTMFLCQIPEQHADIPVPGPKAKQRSGELGHAKGCFRCLGAPPCFSLIFITKGSNFYNFLCASWPIKLYK